jgi:hypothetical protein
MVKGEEGGVEREQPRWIVEDGWRGLDGLESFGGGNSALLSSPPVEDAPSTTASSPKTSSATATAPANDPAHEHRHQQQHNFQQDDHPPLILGRSGLSSLREMLLSPPLGVDGKEKGDPMMGLVV